MIGGAIAADGSFMAAGAGFLGGIVAGFIAGYVAKWIKQVKVPKRWHNYANYYYSDISFIGCRFNFYFVIGGPISSIFSVLTTWLKGMQGTNIIILALVIGAMIAFDMVAQLIK